MTKIDMGPIRCPVALQTGQVQSQISRPSQPLLVADLLASLESIEADHHIGQVVVELMDQLMDMVDHVECLCTIYEISPDQKTDRQTDRHRVSNAGWQKGRLGALRFWGCAGKKRSKF